MLIAHLASLIAMPERLQKILARHGLGSRREIERWIAEGRVTVNLKPAQIGAQYNDGDRIAVDGKEITARLSIEVEAQVIAYHKPQGQPISHDARRSQPTDAETEEPMHPADTGETVMDRLPKVRGSRWVPINPMHAGDSGLLLMTNDGNLCYALTRRKRWIPTAYLVRVLAPAEADTASRIAPAILPRVNYDSGKGNETVEFASVEPAGGEGSNLWYRVESTRADHRAAVRALFESRDLKVSRMTQVSFGGLELPRDLARGRHRTLTATEMAALYELAQIPVPAAPQPKQERRDPRKKKVAPDRRQKTRGSPNSRTPKGRTSKGRASTSRAPKSRR